MRPVYLKMKGVNSFIEEVNIDFNILMSRGIFGIFGPTGSGKSTILDGITLALYGEMSRKSNDFINMNCQVAQVCFQFQITIVDTKTFLVNREFKRDKKTGNIRTSNARIEEVFLGGNKIIAENVNEVTKKCIEIIGLNISDFTRTVVLPQGKFSEFLRLEGRQRRDMLERLFHLYQYGDQLTDKLKQRKKKFENQNNVLEGQLIGYEEVSKENILEKERKLEDLGNEIKENELEGKLLQEDYHTKKMVREGQIELIKEEKEREKIEQEQIYINKKVHKMQQAQKAEKVRPYWEALEVAENQFKERKKEVKGLQIQYEALKEEKEKIEKTYEKIQLEWEKNIPKLHLEQKNLEEAIEEKKRYDEILNLLHNIKEDIKEKKEMLEYSMVEEREVKESCVRWKETLKDLNQKKETLRVDNQWKKEVFEGAQLEEKLEQEKKDLLDRVKELEGVEKELEEIHKKERGIQEEKNRIELQYEKIKESEGELQKNKPYNLDDKIELQKNLMEHKFLWKQYEEILEKHGNKQEMLQKNQKKERKGRKEIVDLERSIAKLKKEYQTRIESQMIFELRKKLRKEETCPVCGSTHWKMELIQNQYNEDGDSLKQLEQEIQIRERNLLEKRNIDTIAKTTILQCQNEMKELEKQKVLLGKGFLARTVQEAEREYEIKEEKIVLYQTKENEIKEKKLQIEDNTKKLEVLDGTLKGSKETLDKQKEKLLLQIQKVTKRKNEIEIKLGVNQEKSQCKNFSKEQNEIFKKEKKLEENLNHIEDFRSNLEKNEDMLQQIKKEKNQFQTEIATLEQKKLNLKERKDEKIDVLETKTKVSQERFKGTEKNLVTWMEEVIRIQDRVKREYEEVKQKRERVSEDFQQTIRRLKEEDGKKNVLEKDFSKRKKELENVLIKEQINSIEESKLLWLAEAEIEKLYKEIEEFNQRKNKIEGRIESLIDKLNGEVLDEKSWEQICQKVEEYEKKKRELDKNYITIKNEVEILKQKEKKQKEVISKKKEIEHKLAVLDELEKLFKGKKFVEYVSTERLYYISLEASKRLKEISNGTYGIEVDKNSKFMIRDYKNGGALRDISTLSGGETFLASLALALALSTEIQLKGTAPLEFFFLDEGFGTLDEELLELVMGSLERIRNDRLNIGIISHVENIKNRVPIKLILTPAQSGLGGSKVRIEKS